MRWKRLYHLQQIYSGNYIQNVITIARVLLQILQNKHFGLFFSGHSVQKFGSKVKLIQFNQTFNLLIRDPSPNFYKSAETRTSTSEIWPRLSLSDAFKRSGFEIKQHMGNLTMIRLSSAISANMIWFGLVGFCQAWDTRTNRLSDNA